MKSPRQLSLLSAQKSMIPLPLDGTHMMIRLADVLDWDELIEIAEEIRSKKILANTGPSPHYRALLGALVVRSLKSCDLRSAEDLVRNYLPARYLCDLHNSQWTPDHDTIWEFEQMLGQEGLHRINAMVLHLAREHGFLNASSLCADTTAQEGKIPYPNEVGLMGSFARSAENALKALGRKGARIKTKIVKRIEKVKKHVRSHRLFAKSKEERLALGRKMAGEIGRMQKELSGYIHSLQSSNLKGHEKTARKKLQDISETMRLLLPQIQHWLDTGWVARDKVVSLFQPELRAIKRGKVARDVEFGLKWGINQFQGGYISLFLMDVMKSHDSDYALAAIDHHMSLFSEPPREFGFDRAAWSQPHMEKMKDMGIDRLAVAPKGSAKWKVSDRCKKRMIRERAQVEGKIGTIKRYGFNRPEEKTTPGMKRAARRAELRFNLTKLMKDLQISVEISKREAA